MSDRPNVVLISADQWRGDALSAAGHDVVRTPALDEIAEGGTRFENAFSATPTCIPARAALMTGLAQESHRRVGYRDGDPFDYPVTLPGEFRRGGYQTRAIGKMHVWPERARIGFDEVVLHDGYVHFSRRGSRSRAEYDDYLPWLQRRTGDPTADYTAHGLSCNGMLARPWDRDEALHPTTWVVSEAIDWLSRRDPTAPFFLYLSFHRPHPPFDPPQWAFDQYLAAPRRDPVVGDWAGIFDDLRVDPMSPEAFAGWMDPDLLHRARAGYFGHMSHIDAQVRRFRESLDEFGLGDNTVFAFVSDHGEMLGDHGLYRKSFPYQGSVHVPFLLSGPRDGPVAGGVVRSEPVELRDVMPSLLDAAGLPIPDGLDGRTVLPLARDEAASWREFLHGEHTLFGQSMQWLTDGQEKYVWLSGSGREQLFDLAVDPHECHDLTLEGDRRERVARWRTRLVEVLTGREEGFVHDGELVSGRPVVEMLSGPAPWRPR
ncbi:arylsulfatase [Nocardioides sp. YIM 152315]|uniref:arylsulfatase n=1 Tax=Nocardioides sp. YIM 152315 TaxID=3031760 RepID=UPI0023DB0C04|nr:arylsulfatase [Nocardioides sp. YIM 152315]MDF1602616.1 arylsulfatase [Nocardioides sp. YIM 152315]